MPGRCRRRFLLMLQILQVWCSLIAVLRYLQTGTEHIKLAGQGSTQKSWQSLFAFHERRWRILQHCSCVLLRITSYTAQSHRLSSQHAITQLASDDDCQQTLVQYASEIALADSSSQSGVHWSETTRRVRVRSACQAPRHCLHHLPHTTSRWQLTPQRTASEQAEVSQSQHREARVPAPAIRRRARVSTGPADRRRHPIADEEDCLRHSSMADGHRTVSYAYCRSSRGLGICWYPSVVDEGSLALPSTQLSLQTGAKTDRRKPACGHYRAML